ncbi:MAG: T9SS type A sorting domain-containing protein [Bacteroidota bacterium]|nr:T9SS type A sorting domain-containing protein [Bacteroidota bacterium]
MGNSTGEARTIFALYQDYIFYEAIRFLPQLKVYDMIGKEIATLLNEFKNVGNYIFDFNASNLTSGIYFYRITSGNFVDTRKMFLAK